MKYQVVIEKKVQTTFLTQVVIEAACEDDAVNVALVFSDALLGRTAKERRLALNKICKQNGIISGVGIGERAITLKSMSCLETMENSPKLEDSEIIVTNLSSYQCSDPFFECVWEKDIYLRIGNKDGSNKRRTERLFWNGKYLEKEKGVVK